MTGAKYVDLWHEERIKKEKFVALFRFATARGCWSWPMALSSARLAQDKQNFLACES